MSTFVDASSPIVIVLAPAFVPISMAPVSLSVPIPIDPPDESSVKLVAD